MKLVVENLSVVRGEDQIFSALSFDIKAGQALIIRGANGVGKSSLLRALAGLLVPASGEIRLDDRDAEFADVPLGELCHYLGNDNAMKGAMSVQENLHFWQNFAGQPHLDIDDALDMVGLDGLQTVPFSHLSTGQRRRIGIARLLVSYRPVWLLDEPTVSLDAASVALFAEAVSIHCAAGGIALAATHIEIGLPEGPRIEIAPPSERTADEGDPFLTGAWS